jgi:hypothetical protein
MDSARCVVFLRAASVSTGMDEEHRGWRWRTMNGGSWTILCRDVAGRNRSVRVVVRGSEVVVVAPAGEAAVLDPVSAVQFRFAVMSATRAPGCAVKVGMASRVERCLGGVTLAVRSCTLPACRGGTVAALAATRTVSVVIPAYQVGYCLHAVLNALDSQHHRHRRSHSVRSRPTL